MANQDNLKPSSYWEEQAEVRDDLINDGVVWQDSDGVWYNELSGDTWLCTAEYNGERILYDSDDQVIWIETVTEPMYAHFDDGEVFTLVPSYPGGYCDA